MPLFFQQDINPGTRLAVWRITEPEAYFRTVVPLDPGIRSPQKRLQHLAARHLLQVLEPGFRYADIYVAPTGRPCLPEAGADFSLSHTGDVAAAILGRPGHVGVDVEQATPRVERILSRFLHPDELGWVRGQSPPRFAADLPEAARWILPTLLWSAKETVYKWQGVPAVEFASDIRFEPFALEASGVLPFRLRRSGFEIPLPVGYAILGTLCLTWLSAPRGGMAAGD